MFNYKRNNNVAMNKRPEGGSTFIFRLIDIDDLHQYHIQELQNNKRGQKFWDAVLPSRKSWTHSQKDLAYLPDLGYIDCFPITWHMLQTWKVETVYRNNWELSNNVIQ